jgi:hypothetical protein
MCVCITYKDVHTHTYTYVHSYTHIHAPKKTNDVACIMLQCPAGKYSNEGAASVDTYYIPTSSSSSIGSRTGRACQYPGASDAVDFGCVWGKCWDNIKEGSFGENHEWFMATTESSCGKYFVRIRFCHPQYLRGVRISQQQCEEAGDSQDRISKYIKRASREPFPTYTTDPASRECKGYTVASPDQGTYSDQYSTLVEASGFIVEGVHMDESDKEWSSIEELEAFIWANFYIFMCAFVFYYICVPCEGVRAYVEMQRQSQQWWHSAFMLFFIMALLPQVSSDEVGKPSCSFWASGIVSYSDCLSGLNCVNIQLFTVLKWETLWQVSHMCCEEKRLPLVKLV